MTGTLHRTQAFFIKHLPLLMGLFLVTAVLAVYWQVQHFDFVFDDHLYITENAALQRGLTTDNIVWAFTDGTRTSNYWHPVTWLSHMLDVEFYGLQAGGHHLTNLLFHLANTLLLLFVFKIMTGHVWRSAFVAALFALHPLHVESVAWVAERKDVLSTFFWLLAMGAYARYAAKPQINRYVVVVLFFVMGLMAKPMLVTLPFVFLLMDFWPLGRWERGPVMDQRHLQSATTSAWSLVFEKIPFFIITIGASIAAYITQRQGGAVPAMDMSLLKMQFANALVAYVGYIWKMIWPVKLAAYYPHPGSLPLWQVAGAGLIIIGASVLGLWQWRQRPYVTFGWFWFLGTLVPVIGLVKIGDFAMADRYTYVPLIGLFVIISWGIPEWSTLKTRSRALLVMLAVALLLVLAVLTRQQTGYWKNDLTLFEHARQVTTNNYIAYNHIGSALEKQGHTEEAVAYYLQALQLNPYYAKAHYNLAVVFLKQNKINKAIRHLSEAVRLEPDFAKAHLNLGNALLKKDRRLEAINHYFEAIRIKPDYLKAYNNLGNALLEQGLVDEAIEVNSTAVIIAPDSAQAHYNLGAAFLQKGRTNKAVDHFRAALNLNPGDVDAQTGLKTALKMQPQTQ